jgi:CheY-like chemotaxis protein
VKPGTRVLVIEDDRSIAQLVELELEERDLDVRCCHDGILGLEAVTEFEPAVILLDIMLPGMDGVGVLKRIRQRGNRVPVIMLTARGASLDKVHSLDLGADDYVTKPFDMEELLARLRALVRRAEGDEEILRVADLEINTATREVRRGHAEDSVDRQGVRAAAVHGPEPAAGSLAGAVALAGVGLRVERRQRQRGGGVRRVPAEEGGCTARVPPHPHRRGAGYALREE